MKLTVNKKILYEFLSVTFAVFLGLMLNQCKDNYNNNRLAKQSKSNILSEITANKSIVMDMVEIHKKTLAKIDSMIPLLDDANKDEVVNIETSFQIISSTSWETAKLTQAIAYMDIGTVTEIAGIYDFQHYYESIVKDFVVNNIYNKPANGDAQFLGKMKTFLEAIIPMENNLVGYYNFAQNQVLNLP